MITDLFLVGEVILKALLSPTMTSSFSAINHQLLYDKDELVRITK